MPPPSPLGVVVEWGYRGVVGRSFSRRTCIRGSVESSQVRNEMKLQNSWSIIELFLHSVITMVKDSHDCMGEYCRCLDL